MNEAAGQTESRRHPDVFTGDEAADYLHLANPATLTWLREQKLLTGHQVGREYMYHREDLDACTCRMFGKAVAGAGKANGRQALRLAGGST